MIKKAIVTNNNKVSRLPYYLRKLGILKRQKVGVTILKLGKVQGVFISKDLLNLIDEEHLSRFLIETNNEAEFLKRVKSLVDSGMGIS